MDIDKKDEIINKIKQGELNPEEQYNLLFYNDDDILKALASSEYTTPAVLHILSKNDNQDIRASVAFHAKNLHVLSNFIDEKNDYVNACLASNPYIFYTTSIPEKLAHSKDLSVQRSLARNKNLDFSTACILVWGGYDSTLQIIASRKMKDNYYNDIERVILLRGDEKVLKALARNNTISTKAMWILATCGFQKVVEALLENEALIEDVKKYILEKRKK